VDSDFSPKPVIASSDQIRHQLVDAVARGELGPGDKLPAEGELALQFGTSKADVHTALRSLASLGVVEISRGRNGGVKIAQPHRDQAQRAFRDSLSLLLDLSDFTMAETVEARREIEAACVRAAARRRSDEDLETMRAILEQAADPSLPDDEWLDLDISFHSAVREAAKNRVMGLPLAAMHAVIQPRLNSLILPSLDRSSIIEQHLAIYDAIRLQDPDAADSALHHHVDHLEELYDMLDVADSLKMTSHHALIVKPTRKDMELDQDLTG